MKISMRLLSLVITIAIAAIFAGQAAVADQVTMIPISSVKAKLSKADCLKKYQQEVARLTDEYGYKFVLSEKEEYVGLPGFPLKKRAVNLADIDVVNRKTGQSAPLKVGEVTYNSLVYQGDQPFCSIDIATAPVNTK